MRSIPIILSFVLTVCGTLIGQDSHPNVECPNIVLINLDDADADLFRPEMLQSFYPNIQTMAQRGLRFDNMHATTPFCGPSRAALFRGQYAFSTGIKINDPGHAISNGFTGGYQQFLDRGYQNDELGVWMKRAGYRTMHVGKYHHHDFDFRVPPGWDDFRVALGANYFANFRFSNADDPEGRSFRTAVDQYVTTVDGDDAVELIQQHAPTDQPFFLYVAPIAPHTPSSFVPEDMVEPRYQNFAADHFMTYSPDLYELDLSDKPRHFQFRAPENWIFNNRRTYISRVRAIKSVDDMVGRIYAALEETGSLSNTYVMLTSDNGFQLGHHHQQSKTDPFHRTTNVPLLVTGPSVPTNERYSHLLAQIDLCPTILDLAHTSVPDSVQAKSFFPLLFDPENHHQEEWQPGIMIENWAKKRTYGRSILSTYVAYRKHHEIFVSWANGEREYYDLNADPFQLDNAYSALSTPQKQQWKRLIRRFRRERIDPITTIDETYRNRIQNRNVKLRGYAEDDAGIFSTLVTMKSTSTDRFWNGESWQDEWYGHYLNVRNSNQPISVWNFKTRVETETDNGFDYLVFTYRSFDSTGVLPDTVAFHVNPIDGKSPVATVDNVTAENGEVNFEGTFFDAVEFDSAIISIRQLGTNKYFNGIDLQTSRVDLPVQLVSDSRWNFAAPLPPGRYVVGIRGIDAAGNRQHPANTLRMTVESDLSVSQRVVAQP